MRFNNTPDYRHETVRKTVVLLVNLGTPDAPRAREVRRYLAQFLSDPRVVEIPKLIWMLILHGIILRVRPAKSAKKYASVWTDSGSPLAIHTEEQTKLLRQRLHASFPELIVDYAMNYGNPSLAVKVDDLARLDAVDRLLVFPLYPQYSATTTASVWDCVLAQYKKLRNPPELRLVKHYHDDAGYIKALAERVRQHWSVNPWLPGEERMLVMTFHGLPQRNLLLGDPYYCECQKTARLLAETLGLRATEYKVTFQSRFGKATWLQPYTEPSLMALAKSHTRVDVVCPGFTSDCLETLEEIAMEAKAAYLDAGGKVFHYITALNETSPWLDALEHLVRKNLQGWELGAPDTELRSETRKRAAMGLGAKN